jgi:F-type H+-transporting ATPase subunit epsilon
MATVHVDIVSAEKSLYSGEAEMLIAPGEAGELGIMPKHVPMLTRLKPGSVRILAGGKEELIYVSGGILEVQPDKITVLSDTAERGADLDEARANEALKKAQESLANREAAIDHAQAQIELIQATAQLAAIRKLRSLK